MVSKNIAANLANKRMEMRNRSIGLQF